MPNSFAFSLFCFHPSSLITSPPLKPALAFNFLLQLYSSMDFGRKWQLVHDNVMPGRFYWYNKVDLARELFCSIIDSNLHNDDVHKFSNLLSKGDLPYGIQAQNPLHPPHVDWEQHCVSSSATQHAVFVCHSHLVISTTRTQGNAY